jgi:hypothetical protein
MWSYLVVLEPDHMELFGCSGPRQSGVIWLFWTQTTWSYLVVWVQNNQITPRGLGPEQPNNSTLSGSKPRQSGVIWLFWTQIMWSYLVVIWNQTKWSYLVVLDGDHVLLFGCSGSRQSGVIWLFWTQTTYVVWFQNNQITPLCLGPEQPNNSTWSGSRTTK